MTNIFTFDFEIIFSSHFHFKSLPEKEREREREGRESLDQRERAQIALRRANERRDRQSRRSSDDRTAPTSSAVHDRDR